jgi:GNAT superfamily N-acetyltransferase
MTEFAIRPMTVPASIADADAADFIAMCELVNRSTEAVLGTDDFSLAPAERLPYAADPARHRVNFVATSGSSVVGWGGYEAQRGNDVRECWIDVHVDAGHRNRGIGSALLQKLIDTAATDDKGQVNTRMFARAGRAGPQVAAASGPGTLAADDAGFVFARGRKFVLEQVAQINRLALPLDAAAQAERREVAKVGYGDDYELLHWSGPTPEVHLDDIARLFTEMSTADPHGNLEVSEDVWDADRIREADDRERNSPRTKLTATARHRASGKLVAFTTLDVPPAPTRPVNQWATMVSGAHRGRRLGLAVKLENLAQLIDDFPGHPSITTINAEENAAMIAVNRSVGFVTVGHGGTLRRHLD